MRGTARHRIAAAMVITLAAAGCASSSPQALASSGSTTAASATSGRSAATTTPTRTVTTKVIVYEPFTRSGAIAAGIDVVGKSSNADCWEGAISTPRRDAFRCATKQNLLYDPCFLDPVGPPRLACWAGPGPSRVVIVTPERPFPQGPNDGSANVKDGSPWLIKLSDGQFCVDQTGASIYFPSIGRANWGCPHGVGWGTVHRHGREWTMGYSSVAEAIGHKAPRLTEMPIAEAWF
jgi:hypothetical protein